MWFLETIEKMESILLQTDPVSLDLSCSQKIETRLAGHYHDQEFLGTAELLYYSLNRYPIIHETIGLIRSLLGYSMVAYYQNNLLLILVNRCGCHGLLIAL